MDMTGQQHVAAPRAAVWAALIDPDVLRQCIPGCQSFEAEGDNRFIAVAEVRIGPIAARFKGAVDLTDLDQPNGYTITGSGNGGIAGHANGGARVTLADAPGGTLVSYTVSAQVGGRMAQLGGPIIDATARNLAGRFFERFGQVVTGTVPVPATGVATVTATAIPAPAASRASGLWGWIAAVLLAAILGYLTALARAPVALALVTLAVLGAVAGLSFEAGRRRGGR